MKRYIRTSRTNATLLLAKGFVVSEQTLDMFDVDTSAFRSSPYVAELSSGHGAYDHLYVAYTECEYDPATGYVSGRLINHPELMVKLGVSDVPTSGAYRCMLFSVDIDPRNSNRTVLTVAGGMSTSIITQLKRMFKVSALSGSTSGVDSDWLDISTAEFKQLYQEAADAATDLIDQSRDAQSKYRVPYFGICYAVIDPATSTGLVADGEPYLFAGYDYKDYTAQAKKFAADLGKQPKELLFKTVYRETVHQNNSEYDTGKSQSYNLYGLINILRAKFNISRFKDISAHYNTSNGAAWVERRLSPRKKRSIALVLDRRVLEPEYDPDIATIKLPTHFKYYPGFEDEIARLLK